VEARLQSRKSFNTTVFVTANSIDAAFLAAAAAAAAPAAATVFAAAVVLECL
jgi:hypothetical protein